jgi:hypothetical protein
LRSCEISLRKSVDRSQYDFPVPERDTKRLQVGFRDMRKRPKIDVVLDERLNVFAKAELAQPILNRLHRASSPSIILLKLGANIVAASHCKSEDHKSVDQCVAMGTDPLSMPRGQWARTVRVKVPHWTIRIFRARSQPWENRLPRVGFLADRRIAALERT